MDILAKIKGWVSLLPAFSLSGLVEIAILAGIIYVVLLWIKNTRAWQLFKGILMLLLFTAFAVFFRLNTIVWLIERVSTAAIIAAVIILEQLGSKNLFGQFQKEGGKGSLRVNKELIAACQEMSKYKTGALIVIEQNQSLKEVEDTGIYVDGIVTAALLINIFEKNTPLHDGAVVISRDRVASATCYLPLSDTGISKAYGTRHRAALGISESTDAITLVVSEETGRISVAFQGKLLHVKEAGELIDFLPKEEKEEQKKTLISRILPRKKEEK